MKTLIILSAFLLALSSCTKEMPVPDPCQTYVSDPDQQSDPDPDPDPQPDPGDDDPGPYCNSYHPGSTVAGVTTTTIHTAG